MAHSVDLMLLKTDPNPALT